MTKKEWGVWVDSISAGWVIDSYDKRTNDAADWVEIHTKFKTRREAQECADDLNTVWKKRKKIYSAKEYK